MVNALKCKKPRPRRRFFFLGLGEPVGMSINCTPEGLFTTSSFEIFVPEEWDDGITANDLRYQQAARAPAPRRRA